jgi:hypothetical protein
MNLQQRINLLTELGHYMLSGDPLWLQAKKQAFEENRWFIPAFIDKAVQAIGTKFLNQESLLQWAHSVDLPKQRKSPVEVGLVMAGNIPLVGFHDFLAVFISGNRQTIKPSKKDSALIRHLVQKLFELDPDSHSLIKFADMLKNCGAYIATGSNSTGPYFDYYFGKYPHIIRGNRTSVAILRGQETQDDLEKLADDILLYFGLGCRNVTKIYVPTGYDFSLLLKALTKYQFLIDEHKYKNNFDYQLTLMILNKVNYITNESILVSEQSNLFSPISVLHYEFYHDPQTVFESVSKSPFVQLIVGDNLVPFGQAQFPGLQDYADGINTLDFLRSL